MIEISFSTSKVNGNMPLNFSYGDEKIITCVYNFFDWSLGCYSEIRNVVKFSESLEIFLRKCS